MPTLLILSYFFPPSNDIAARRFGTMAGWLESLGFNVYILTTFSQGSLPQDIDEGAIGKNLPAWMTLPMKNCPLSSIGSANRCGKKVFTCGQWIAPWLPGTGKLRPI